MRKYTLFFIIIGIQLYSMEEKVSSEIAINPNGRIVPSEDGFRKPQLFVPIVIYGKNISYGLSIPLEALESSNDGDYVIDNYEGSRNVYTYRCNQSRQSPGQTFQEALAAVRAKKQH